MMGCYYKISWPFLIANLLLSLLLLLSSESDASSRICPKNRLAHLERSFKADCGKTGFSFTNRIGKHNRISGGYEAKTGEFPSFVSLRIKTPISVSLCSGVLIGSDVVLTAAHCLDKLSLISIEVGIGIVTQPNWYKMGAKVHKASTSCYSPLWGGIRNPIYDYGIVILKEPVKLSRDVQPACLPEQTHSSYSQAYAVGTGKIDDRGTIPIMAQVLPVKEIACNIFDQHTTHICFSSNQREYIGDTCLGDSGGPIYVDQNGKQTVIGLTSYGPDKCTRGFSGYSVNTNTYNLKQKILQLVETCQSIGKRLKDDEDDDVREEDEDHE